MFTRKSGILALALSVLVLGACEDDTTLPPPAATITIAPNPVPTLQLNAPFTLVAVTTNAPAGSTVTWASSNNAAVSVSAAGVVTCLQAGATATITATISGTNPPVQSAVAVACAQDTTPPPGQVVISIQSITDNDTGLPVNPGNVSGVITVRANVDVPQNTSVSTFNVKLGSTVACTQTYTGGTGAMDAAASVPVPVECSVNTAQLNAQGAPLFPNGQTAVVVEALNPQGTQIASASTNIVLNNMSALIVSVASAANALDANGLRWEGGNLSVTVTPSIFSANTTFSTINVSVIANDTMGVQQTITKSVSTTGVAPVTVVFRADSSVANKGLQGLEDATTMVQATGITTQGQPFDSAGGPFNAPIIRYDDAAPRLTGAVVAYNLAQHPISGDSFFVATSGFASACSSPAANTYNCGSATSAGSVTGVTEAGVDVVTVEFQTSPSTGTATWTTRTSAAAIGQQAPDAVFARLRVCDKLGNCKNTPAGPRFGVDLVSPFINAVTNVSGVQAGPTVPVAVAAIDTGAFSAGFNTVTGYVQVQIVKDSASSSGANVSRCVSVATGTSAANTAVPSGGCAFNTVANATGSFTIDPAISGNGYYTVTVRAVDIAGNMTTTTQRFFLLDVAGGAAIINPAVTGVSVTYTTGAATANASASIHDNVDLAEYNSRVMFSGAVIGGANTLPFTTPTTHKAFGVPVSGNAAPSTNVQVIKGVWNQLVAGAALLGSINGIGFSAYDQAGNYGEGYAGFATTASTALTSTDVVSSSVTTADDPLCKSSGCTTDPTSTTASAEIVMQVTATTNPVQTVYFYYLDAAGRAVYISQTNAGALTIPSSGPNANLRVFTYTSGSISTADLALGANTIFAVGVDADGDAALLGSYVVTVN
jgi:hypothetical protein